MVLLPPCTFHQQSVESVSALRTVSLLPPCLLPLKPLLLPRDTRPLLVNSEEKHRTSLRCFFFSVLKIVKCWDKKVPAVPLNLAASFHKYGDRSPENASDLSELSQPASYRSETLTLASVPLS